MERHKDGYTEREHLEAAAQRSLSARLALAGPGLPREAAYLWDWFCELNAARGSSGFGPNPIAYADILAWAKLTGRRLRGWEVRWLVALDRVWTADVSKAAQ